MIRMMPAMGWRCWLQPNFVIVACQQQHHPTSSPSKWMLLWIFKFYYNSISTLTRELTCLYIILSVITSKATVALLSGIVSTQSTAIITAFLKLFCPMITIRQWNVCLRRLWILDCGLLMRCCCLWGPVTPSLVTGHWSPWHHSRLKPQVGWP